jgi:hypothetical protein
MSTTTTATAGQSGITFVVTAEDITATLPAVAAGLQYRFLLSDTAGTTGLIIDVPSTVKMKGNGFTSANGKGAQLTSGNSREGDSIEIYCDGTDYWITSVTGTWTREL